MNTVGSEAPALPAYPVFAQPQVSAYSVIPQPAAVSVQAPAQQTEAAVPAQHAIEKDTEKDSSGLVHVHIADRVLDFGPSLTLSMYTGASSGTSETYHQIGRRCEGCF